MIALKDGEQWKQRQTARTKIEHMYPQLARRLRRFTTALLLMGALSGCSNKPLENLPISLGPDTLYCEKFHLLELRPINTSKYLDEKHCVQVIQENERLISTTDFCSPPYQWTNHFNSFGRVLVTSQEVDPMWPPTINYRLIIADSLFDIMLHLEPIGRNALKHKESYDFKQFEFDTLEYRAYLDYVYCITKTACEVVRFDHNAIPFEKAYFNSPQKMLSCAWLDYSLVQYSVINPQLYQRKSIGRFANDPSRNIDKIECVKIVDSRTGGIFITPWWGGQEVATKCP